MKKTNAIRQLERLGLLYSPLPYRYDPENLDVGYIAEENGFPVSQIFKTLVLKADRMPVLVAVIPGDHSLDLKALARVSGNKKVLMAAIKDLKQLTGYIRGGCSPLGMKKSYPVFVHISALDLELLYVNAGIRGLLIGLHPDDLVKACQGSVEEIAIPMS